MKAAGHNDRAFKAGCLVFLPICLFTVYAVAQYFGDPVDLVFSMAWGGFLGMVATFAIHDGIAFLYARAAAIPPHALAVPGQSNGFHALKATFALAIAVFFLLYFALPKLKNHPRGTSTGTYVITDGRGRQTYKSAADVSDERWAKDAGPWTGGSMASILMSLVVLANALLNFRDKGTRETTLSADARPPEKV